MRVEVRVERLEISTATPELAFAYAVCLLYEPDNSIDEPFNKIIAHRYTEEEALDFADRFVTEFTFIE